MRAERIAYSLILAGIAIMILAIIIIPIQLILSGNASVSGGGCIVILFFPICFGFGEEPLLMTILAMILAIVVTLLGYLSLRTLGRVSQ